jgi:hypothetical protein
MSIFYRESRYFLQQSIDRAFTPEVEDLRAAKDNFAERYLGEIHQSINAIVPLIYNFSYVIFANLGFYKMQHEEVVGAWASVKARVNLENLGTAIFDASSDQHRERFLKTFDFVEVISIEGAILARLDEEQKVLPAHMETAFLTLRFKCPYRIYGIC